MTQGIALVVDFAAERCFVLSGYCGGKNLVPSLPKSDKKWHDTLVVLYYWLSYKQISFDLILCKPDIGVLFTSTSRLHLL